MLKECTLSSGSGVLRSHAEASRVRKAGGQVPARKVQAGLPAEVADVVVQRYSAGESGETIAVKLGLSHVRVYKFLGERGVLRTLSEASALREERRRKAELPKEKQPAQMEAHAR